MADINLPFAQSLIAEGRARGYSDMQIAQVLGSAAQENSLRTSGNPGDNGTAFGGFQWRLDREQALRQKAAQAGVDWTDPGLQSRHYYDELDGSENRAGRMLRAAQTPEEAQRAVISSLRPAGWTSANPQGGHGWENRLNNGNRFFAAMGGATSAPGNPDAPAPGAVTAEGTQNTPMAQAFAAQRNPAAAAQATAQPSAWDRFSAFMNGGKPGNLSDGLMGAGAIMQGGWGNPQGGTVTTNVMNNLNKPQTANSPWERVNYNPETGKALSINKQTGAYKEEVVGTPFKKLSDKELETFNEREGTIATIDSIIKDGDKFRNMLADGKINLNLLKQGETAINNLTNQSTEADRNAGEYWRYLERMRNASLNLAKGTQTDRDAARVMNEYISGTARFDNAQSVKAIDNIVTTNRRAAQSNMASQETILNTYKDQAPPGTYRDNYQRYREEYDGLERNFASKRDAYFKRLEAERAATENAGTTSRVAPGRSTGGSTGSSGGSLADKIRRDNGL